ncbi:MAG: hypothetical protein K2Y07_10315 [Nitrosomonas sp.]|nr:hypothetical protein [Nitrosomonas sp.]OQW81807.1 MAG: hypothetical protein BVN30_10385 [Proteobacteria bacterium ST_bin16]
MTIIQDLYNVFDKERARYDANKAWKNAVLRELAENLAFMREGLRENLDDSKIINNLESKKFVLANDNGFNFNSIKGTTLSPKTYGDAKEFDKYKDWSTDKLIKNAYERISTLRKLKVNEPSINARSRLQNLFKFLMVILAHVDEKPLTITNKSAR